MYVSIEETKLRKECMGRLEMAVSLERAPLGATPLVMIHCFVRHYALPGRASAQTFQRRLSSGLGTVKLKNRCWQLTMPFTNLAAVAAQLKTATFYRSQEKTHIQSFCWSWFCWNTVAVNVIMIASDCLAEKVFAAH